MAFTFTATNATPAAELQPEPTPKEPERVIWRDEWARFRTWQYVATPALVGGSIYMGLGVGYPSSGWREPLLFDSVVRDALVADSRAGRDRARLVSDITWRALTVYPLLIEPVGVTWLGHDSADVAAQTWLINVQSFAWSGFLSLLSLNLVGRARPSVEPCEDDPDYEAFCGGSDRYASFPSGHSAIAMTGATLVCVHAEHLPLYGGAVGNRIACYTGLVGAFAVGAARIVNDRHYATDVLAGTALGAAAGYLVPKWLHYGFSDNTEAAGMDATHLALMPLVSPGALGISVSVVQ